MIIPMIEVQKRQYQIESADVRYLIEAILPNCLLRH